MDNLLELYELDLELSCRLISPTTLGEALRDQGLAANTVDTIIQLCEKQKFHTATKLAVNSGCNFERVNQYLETKGLERRRF